VVREVRTAPDPPPASTTQLEWPWTARGIFFVGDTSNCTIRMITPAGLVTTLAGLAGSSGSTDGTGSAARFFYPRSVAADRRWECVCGG